MNTQEQPSPDLTEEEIKNVLSQFIGFDGKVGMLAQQAIEKCSSLDLTENIETQILKNAVMYLQLVTERKDNSKDILATRQKFTLLLSSEHIQNLSVKYAEVAQLYKLVLAIIHNLENEPIRNDCTSQVTI